MKHLKGILRLHFWLFLLFAGAGTNTYAQTALTEEEALRVDSTISIGLLTCQPGQEAYSLYGHTAIHYVDREKGIDVAVNYGIFDMSKSHFVLRFIFGLTDYLMGIQPYDYFCGAYAYERRGIVEQELNIPAEEKIRFAQAIEENYRPENRVYRYNIFYNNCTTKARDMILGPMKAAYQRQADGPSFRELTHQYTKDHPWTELGNDLLLGLKADRPTNVSEQQFLPFNLMDDFESAVVADTMKLVSATKTIVPMFDNPVEKEFPLSPTVCALLVALVIVVVTIVEFMKRRRFWGFDLVLLLLIGFSGLILTAMIFSQHPTVNLNLQILLLNPLAIVCLWPVVRNERKGRSHWFWKAYALCLLLFFAGNLLQCYAEGTNILALSLLIHCIERIINRKNPSIPNNQNNPNTPSNQNNQNTQSNQNNPINRKS